MRRVREELEERDCELQRREEEEKGEGKGLGIGREERTVIQIN